MNYRASTRFQTGTENGKPVIFWEQQAQSKEKKKFSYKDKSMKHPLRSTKQKSLEEASPTHKPTVNNGKSTAAKPARQKGSVVRKEGGEAKVNRTASTTKKQSEANNIGSGTVTLTEGQLNTILETIGRLTISNQELSESQKAVLMNTAKLQTKDAGSSDRTGVQAGSNGGDNIYNMAKQTEQTPEPSVLSPSPDSTSKEPGSNMQHDRTNTNRGMDRSAPSVPVPGVEHKSKEPGVTNKVPIPKQHLTKAELKRLQWEREKAEVAGSYNPWGKPGAGAPIRDRTGNVLADYKVRKDDTRLSGEFGGSNYALGSTRAARADTYIVGANTAVGAPKSAWVDSNSVDQLTRESLDETEEKPVKVGRSSSTQPVSTGTIADRFKDAASVEPAAMRSSFAIGAAAPNAEKYNDVKAQQKKQWLEDLEKQREEQRLRKEADRQKMKGEQVQDTWADRMGDYKPKGLPPQNATPAATVDDTAALQISQRADGTRTNSAPTEKIQGGEDPLSQSQNASYIRGQNAILDPETRKEMEEKKRRHLEHQEYIKQQVEERQRKKREERERKIQEDLEEERKLQAERERIQQLYKMEQDKLKNKEENAKKRLEDIKKAMDDAKEQADKEKHEKRLRKLAEGGHQTTRYHEKFEEYPGKQPPKTQRTSRPLEVQQDQNVLTHVEPSHVPGLDLSSITDNKPPADYYTQNRLLTPSQFRNQAAEDPTSPRREFGTQTDPNIKQHTRKAVRQDDSSDTTDMDTRRTSKKVRVKSAPKENKEEKVDRRDIKSRPKWGQSNSRKTKAIKNSEKDPDYEKNRKHREANRKMRQERLLAEADKYAKYVPGVQTAASRARSRSPPQGQSRQTLNSRTASSPPGNRSRSVRKAEPSPAPAVRKAHDPSPQMDSDLGIDHFERANQGPTSQRSQSNNRANSPPIPTHRPRSPPVPAMKRNSQVENDYNVDTYNFDNYNHKDSRPQGRGQERANLNSQGAPNEQFVPFVRSTNVLDPAHAESPIPVSRENTAVERARRAYLQNAHPANYGVQLDNFNDPNSHQTQKPNSGRQTSQLKDPILNPDLVKKNPTERQGQILQQLTELRKGLLMKQRELEIMAPLQTVEVE